MKNLKLGLWALLCFCLSTCGGDDGDGDGIDPGDGCSASWTVNGENYSIDNLALCLLANGTFNMSAIIGGGDFQLQIEPLTSTGTFIPDVNNPDQFVLITMVLNDGTEIGIKNGQIEVTEFSNDRVSGTFSGTFFDFQDANEAPDFTVTNGQFRANL